MTNPVVDVLSAPDTERDPTPPTAPAPSCRCTRSPGRPRSTRGSCAASSPRASSAPSARGFADPLDARHAVARTTSSTGRARTGASTAPSRWTTCAPPRTASSSTSSCACRSGSWRASGRSPPSATGIAHVVDGALVPRVPRAAPVPAHRATRSARSTRSPPTWRAPAPMHRLLQGEVGSGKTVVALDGAAHRGAGRLPGRVHGADRGARRAARRSRCARCSTGSTVPAEGTLLGERPVRVALLTNRTPAAERRRIADGPASAGEVDILVGTHALIYEGVEFARLGVVVIDEQHRFGVEQRDLLRAKGDAPDVLVMTATPIPRTAAMLIYGDLDKTELRELPAGRSPITTEVVGPGPLERVGGLRARARRGRGGPPGLRRVPARRGVRQARGARRDRGARAARGRGARRPAARAAPRPDAVGRQGGGDGRASAPARSTCSSRRP